ncbi:MAG: M23 family metallopeptidase [Thermonemataceae bacterium]|nr:M23 family metallopeptidase [Thermonemataceae bacterium]
MAKIKYYYDTESCRYERVQVKKSDILLNIIGFIFFSGLFGLSYIFLYAQFHKSDKEAELVKEIEELKSYYQLINKKLDESDKVLSSLQERDDKVYRVIFSADPVPMSARIAGAGGADKYADLLKKGLNSEKLVLSTLQKIDRLKRKMYVQSKSYDEIMQMARSKEDRLAHIPAIQPISNKELTRLTSGFGTRFHPIFGGAQFHPGIDFAAPHGTPIYATADGEVTVANNNFGGYGNEIQIKHSEEYTTLYAHMSRFNVSKGQKVKRGECIGYVGSTGFSTAPHLHYEVIFKGEKVNPVYYFYNDLSPEQYDKILELASRENKSLGAVDARSMKIQE